MAGSYNGIAVPADGKKIGYAGGKYHIPDNPIIPFIEGDGTGRDIWKASRPRVRCRGREGLQGQAPRGVVRSLCRRKGQGEVRQLAARRHCRCHSRVPRRHQRPADHAGGRRHPFAERRAASDSRSLCLRSPGEVLPGRAFAGEASGADERRHLPRKHRRRLRRHRVGAGNTRSCAS